MRNIRRDDSALMLSSKNKKIVKRAFFQKRTRKTKTLVATFLFLVSVEEEDTSDVELPQERLLLATGLGRGSR